MNDNEPITSANKAERTVVENPERTAATPHFDAVAVKSARPAVPIARAQGKHSWLMTLIIAAAIAGLAGGIIGSVLTTSFLRPDSAQAPPATAGPETDAPQTEPEAAQDVPPGEQDVLPAAPPDVSTAPADGAALSDGPVDAVERHVSAVNVERQASAANDDGRRGEPALLRSAPPKEDEAALRAALEEWVTATNERDLGKQMSFYGPTVSAFYRARNASQAVVRADKARAFRNANSINVSVRAPQITIGPDGRSASMRFRKQYAIAGGGEDRSGEVIQELRWRLVDGKWRIVSERDLKVVR